MNVRCCLAVNAFNRCFDLAFATVFKLLNRIAGEAIVIPFINKYARIFSLIPAILACFLFTSKSREGYEGNGNGKFFHNTQNINKVLN